MNLYEDRELAARNMFLLLPAINERDYYRTEGGIDSHLCPFCEDWSLEAPALWPLSDVDSIMRTHLSVCAKVPTHWIKFA